MLLLVLIVWWTMFSGRNGGEPVADEAEEATAPTSATTAHTATASTTASASNSSVGLPATSVPTKSDQAQV